MSEINWLLGIILGAFLLLGVGRCAYDGIQKEYDLQEACQAKANLWLDGRCFPMKGGK